MRQKVATKFPVVSAWFAYRKTRIKKIMQKDESIGKVSSATPLLIAKALECFLSDMLCQIVDNLDGKKISVAHLKTLIESTDQFDFLRDLVENVEETEKKVAKKPRKSKDDGQDSKEDLVSDGNAAAELAESASVPALDTEDYDN